MKTGWLCTVLIVLIGCSSKERGVKEQPAKVPVKVEVAEVLETTIPIFLEGIGHVRAFNSADIKSRIEGELMAVHYEQGDLVPAGASLVTIDPRPYQAQLEEAEGVLLESKANLRFAEEKVMRYTRLVEEDYVSKLNYDEYVTNVESLLATVKKNTASLENAKVNLNYCYIKAPFTGRIGKKLVDQGNLIANDGSTLLTLNQIQPIYVDFSLPEKQCTRILMKQSEKQLPVKVNVPEVVPVQEEGELIVVDNRVDPETGMIPLRAQFANPRELLWPGQFVKVRLILEEKPKALLVPEAAVNLGQKGVFALVVDMNHVVSIRPIKVGERINGVYEIIDGLHKGDLVVTQGQINITPGDKVEIVAQHQDFLKDINIW